MNVNNNRIIKTPNTPEIASKIINKIKKAKETVIVWAKWASEWVKYEYNSSKKNSTEANLEKKWYIIYSKWYYKDYILCKKQIQKTYPYKREFAVYDLKKNKLETFENGLLAKQYIEKEKNGDSVMQSDNVEIEFNK